MVRAAPSIIYATLYFSQLLAFPLSPAHNMPWAADRGAASYISEALALTTAAPSSASAKLAPLCAALLWIGGLFALGALVGTKFHRARCVGSLPVQVRKLLPDVFVGRRGGDWAHIPHIYSIL